MFLHDYLKGSSSIKKTKRLGRGNGSGKGNYSTRGIKGQKARSGYTKNPGFEGGQTSLNMRLPKLRGFKRYYKLVDNYEVVNLSDLQLNNKILSGDTINKKKLKELGIIRSENSLVKILAKGELDKKLFFVGIDSYSKSAKSVLESVGCKFE
ncbi:50S ribosomal protein L15 [Candidatus Vampirococcus lugosii]|uniref:Large ribosomal subunit protein uL15 n=1 Tax=Candidatus Vampirococcus lugosii TaxID=2789015 RepID=A0ABS5QL12_9BACT|nr:50S ribosomal protein L15 [Candidatus Vampirococcus lugosii]MBS8121886.1 50S ribosomal protein L15 [Candidatus Vampirococcus lugosii]